MAETVPSLIDNSQPQTQQVSEPETQAQSTSQQTTSTETINQYGQTTTTTQRIDLSDGVPIVTTDQAAAKANRMTMELHRLFTTIAPMVTIAVLVIGGIFFLFSRSARASVALAIIALIIVMWSIPIVGYILHLINA